VDDNLVDAIANLHEQEALTLIRERLEAGGNPDELLVDSRKAMEIVGKRFEGGVYFIPDLIYSGYILNQVTELIKPKFKKMPKTSSLGKVIIGTIAGDIHDIGKNIVVFMLEVSGFEVYDLGVDVPAQKFVEKIEETKAPIVGLSGFLTLSFDSMKQTIEAIMEAGFQKKLRIMIGGGQVDENVRKYTGADAYGRDAISAVSLAKQWIGDRR
jgi:5-methyltetrahydrofolate--homocysteine methyltransferase